MEVMALNKGSEFAERIVKNEKYSKTWYKRVGFYVGRSISFYTKWTTRTNIWENRQQENKKQRKGQIDNYSIGLSRSEKAKKQETVIVTQYLQEIAMLLLAMTGIIYN